MVTSFLPFAFLALASLHYNGEYIAFSWYPTIISMPLIFLYGTRHHLRNFYAIDFALLFCLYYLLVTMAHVTINPVNHLSENTQAVRMNLALLAFAQVAFILIPILCFLFSKEEKLLKMKSAWVYWALLNSSFTVLNYFFKLVPLDVDGVNGLLDNPSHNGCMIAVLIPLILEYKNKAIRVITFILAISAVLLSKASIPVGTAVLGILVYKYLESRKIKFHPDRRFALLMAFLLCLGIMIAARLHDGQLFNSSGRLQGYRVFMTYWANHANILFGVGPGSFASFGPSIQLDTGFHVHSDDAMSAWIFMHSEWLELLFSYGLIGLFLGVTVFVLCLKRFLQREENALFALSIAFSASLCFNYHTRYSVGGLLLGYLISTARSLKK